MRQVPPGARVSPQGVPPALWAPPLPRPSGRAPGCARCGRGPLGVSPRVRRGGRPLGRAVLPTLLGVPASKVLGVGRIPFWGRSDPCRGHPGWGVAWEQVGKAASGCAGTRGRPCVPARRPGPDAGGRPRRLRWRPRRGSRPEAPRRPAAGRAWAAELPRHSLSRASRDQLCPLSPDAPPTPPRGQRLVHLKGFHRSAPSMCLLTGRLPPGSGDLGLGVITTVSF